MSVVDCPDSLRQLLLGHSLSQLGDVPLQARYSEPLRADSLRLTPAGQVSLRIFNRPEDKDEDAIFGEKSHIAFDLGSAWVRYKAALQQDARIPWRELTAGGSASIELSDYRIHDASESAFAAISADLASPRTLLSLDDVRALRPGEALAMEIGGSLTASVSFSWSDVIGAKLGEIVQGLVPRVRLAVKLGPDAGVTARVKVSDQFAVVVSRTREGMHRIAVKKAKSRNHTLAMEVTFAGEISAVPAIDDALDAIVEAIGPEGKREEAAAKALRAKLRDRLVDAAKWKASTGFQYEYARIEENTSIADFVVLDDAQLAGDYALAMSGDFARVTDALRRDPRSRQLLRYLNETTLTRRSASGFSLGLGKWTALETKDSSVFKLTTRESVDGFRLCTARGTRRYEEKVPQNDFVWTVDLKAQMREFAEMPTTLDFDYGLHCAVLLERAKLGKSDLERMLDFACMWDVCVPDRALFEDAIGRKASLRLQWMLERDAMQAVLGTVDDSLEPWAEPLAAAMPYLSKFPERRSYASRRDLYRDAWRAFLAGQNVELSRRQFRSALGAFEQQGLPSSFAWVAGDGHPQLRRRLSSFLRGARALHTAMTVAQPPIALADAYASLSQFWSQRLYIAACGTFLLARAREAQVPANVTLQVEYADGTTVTT